MTKRIIAKPYSKALLDFATKNSESLLLYEQASNLLELLKHNYELKSFFDCYFSYSIRKKTDLLASLKRELSFCGSLCVFLDLLIKRRRLNLLVDILEVFVSEYLKHNNYVEAQLRIRDKSEQVEERLRILIQDRFSKKLLIRTTIDPSIIGGFVFIIDDLRIDTTVRRQLETIKSSFILMD